VAPIDEDCTMMLKLFGRKNPPRYSEELGHVIREVPPANKIVRPDTEFIAVPKQDIEYLVNKYVAAMETEESADWCKCLWAVHPDDQELKKGACRECGATKDSSIHKPSELEWQSELDHQFRGIRKRRVDDHPYCPVHTREGMVSYFFEWVFTYAEKH
jgi:hypothetical protein